MKEQTNTLDLSAFRVKPFLRWAGGKTQLLPVINEKLPKEVKDGTITRYVEPFLGGGAVLFHLLQHYPIEEAFVYDINKDLINVYQTIKDNVEPLITLLQEKEAKYLSLSNEERKEMFYSVRQIFNKENEDIFQERTTSFRIHRAAMFIFLNKTCFNGLFRVNKKGFFNVPYGGYRKNQTITNARNLKNVHILLQRVVLKEGNYADAATTITPNTFVYFDPPYRPLTKTSTFTAYDKNSFTDENQKELASFFFDCHHHGAKLMLSNADPQNVNKDDFFFYDLYEKEGITISSVQALRTINSKANKRGKINELLITNY